jgi:EPS-associated MarR family transcriptional regulator
MYHMKLSDDLFNTLRKIHKNPEFSQRKLAGDMGFSLGKMNYCLNELKKKGFIKIENFKKNPKKLKYMYLLTPSGISVKTKLTINFMKKKMQEYDELQNEIKKK